MERIVGISRKKKCYIYIYVYIKRFKIRFIEINSFVIRKLLKRNCRLNKNFVILKKGL